MSKRLKMTNQNFALNFYSGRFGKLFFSYEFSILTIRSCQGINRNGITGFKKNCLSDNDFEPFLQLLEKLPSVQIIKKIDVAVENDKIELLDHLQISPEVAIGLYLEGKISEKDIQNAKILEFYQDGDCSEMTAIVFEDIELLTTGQCKKISFAVVFPQDDSLKQSIVCINVHGKAMH